MRVRGGNTKSRAMRLETGNYAWGSEHCTRKTRIIGVVYNASNNELVRTNTLVKSAIVQIDATPFRQWYESHYGVPVSKRLAAKKGEDVPGADVKKSNHVKRTLAERQKQAKIDPLLESQFSAGRLYASISSRPGQSGRADGYILEGKELEVRRALAQLTLACADRPTLTPRSSTFVVSVPPRASTHPKRERASTLLSVSGVALQSTHTLPLGLSAP